MEGAPTQPAVVALATDCCSCNGETVRREAGSWGLGEGKGWKDEDWGLAPPLGAIGRDQGCQGRLTLHPDVTWSSLSRCGAKNRGEWAMGYRSRDIRRKTDLGEVR